MNKKDLFSAIGKIDDKFIQDATNIHIKVKKRNFLKKIISVAAVVVLMISGIAFGIPKLTENGDMISQNEFGIIVKAENFNNKSVEVKLEEEKEVKLDEVNIEKIINYLCDYKKFNYLFEDNNSSKEEFYLDSPEYSFEKSENGYVVSLNNDEKVEIQPTPQIDNIWNYLFEFVGENIKTVTVKGETGEISYKKTNDKISINFLPLTSIKHYFENESAFKNNYSKLPKDNLFFYVVFEDGSELEKTVELYWDKDGFLVVKMK